MASAKRVKTSALLKVDPEKLVEISTSDLATLRNNHSIIQFGEFDYAVLRPKDVFNLLRSTHVHPLNGAKFVQAQGFPDGYAAQIVLACFQPPSSKAHAAEREVINVLADDDALQKMRARIHELAARQVALLSYGETIDFGAKVAAPLAARSITAFLGLPITEAAYVSDRAAKLAQAMSPLQPLGNADEIETAARELFAYVDSYLRLRLSAPRKDGLSRMAQNWRKRRTAPVDALVRRIIGFMIRAQPLANAFIMLVAQLLDRPSDWEALRADRRLIPGAIDEALRFEPPVGALQRRSSEVLHVGGAPIPANSNLLLSTLFTGADPALGAARNAFDIRRRARPHRRLSFGDSAHRCPGETLGRLIFEQGLEALLDAEMHMQLMRRPQMTGGGPLRRATPMSVCLQRIWPKAATLRT